MKTSTLDRMTAAILYTSSAVCACAAMAMIALAVGAALTGFMAWPVIFCACVSMSVLFGTMCNLAFHGADDCIRNARIVSRFGR